jgi:lipopolysaccharide transport system ATP-binding protein
MNETVIAVEHLYKEYKLGVISHGTLYRDLQSWWARVRGKEDPNSLISARHRDDTEKDSFLALEDVSFKVKQGDRIGIIGKNGAGKSTLLKILSRITSPTGGTAKIKGRVGALLEVGTGFHSELTGRENIYLNGAILGMSRREISRKLDEVVDFAGIEKYIDTPVKRYSSGMNVRLGFAVAAHLDTDILIADEVLAVGDAEFHKKALGKMRDLGTGEGRTILFVSHNHWAIRTLCNCGLLLEKGRIREYCQDIVKLTSDYLNNFKQYGNRYWVNNDGITDCCFNPISMELEEEDGQPVKAEITADRNYRIKLVYEVQEQSNDLEFHLKFWDTEGNELFVTAPMGSATYGNVQFISSPPGIEIYRPKLGVNIIYCFIPKDFLNIREYIVSLGAAVRNVRVIRDSSDFQVSINMNVVKKGFAPVSPHTIVAPQVKWYFDPD